MWSVSIIVVIVVVNLIQVLVVVEFANILIKLLHISLPRPAIAAGICAAHIVKLIEILRVVRDVWVDVLARAWLLVV